MATVNKDFRVKHGLVVEGTTGTINGENIITTGFNTDSLSEGTTNQYFTDARAKDSAAALLTTATTTNITITGTGNGGLTITAENGVADSTTDDLQEGLNNLYFTDTRVKNVIDQAITNGTQSNIVVTYDDATNTLSFAAENGVDDSTTDDLTEGVTNLYFTDQRAIDAVVNGAVDTDDIEEGATNLYFTNQRAIDAVVNGSVDTDDIEEGTTNLYYTDTRARNALSAGNGITYTASTGEIAVDTGVIADKAYVDSVAAGLTWKGAVNLLANTNIALTGNTGTLSIDGHGALDQTKTGYRILAKNQTTASENGIYEYTDNGTTYTLARSDDADTIGELIGVSVFVLEGNTYANTGWVQSDHYMTTFADQDWVQFSGSGTYTGGTGINIDGNIISVDANTDEVVEGSTNLYFTDARAVSAVVNGAVDTDDIEEGSTNLYFTNARAQSAVAGDIETAVATGDVTATPAYLALNVNNVIKQVAAEVECTGGGDLLYSWLKADYRSAKFIVRVSSGTHTEISEVLFTLDTSDNVAVTEYGMVSTSGSSVVNSMQPQVNGNDVLFFIDVNTSCTVSVFGTLIA